MSRTVSLSLSCSAPVIDLFHRLIGPTMKNVRVLGHVPKHLASNTHHKGHKDQCTAGLLFN